MERNSGHALGTPEAAAIAARLRANVERALRGKPEVVRRTVEALLAGGSTCSWRWLSSR